MDAEDCVQEAYLRWQQADAAQVRDPRAYLSTVVTRLCLDQLRSARVRREVYVGPWLPEPLVGALPAADTVEQVESLSMAFLLLLERLSSIPGVRSASFAAMTPISGAGGSLFVDVDGFVVRPEDRRRVQLNIVGPKYFETLSTSFIAGRDFEAADARRPRVAIVNRAMARYWEGTDPIGTRISANRGEDWFTVVGIVGDVRQFSLAGEPQPMF